MSLEPRIYRNRGVLWTCDDTLELDAVVSAHVGIDPNEVGYLKLAAENFGEWEEESVAQATNHQLSSIL